LRVTGPRRYQALALELLGHKAELIPLLRVVALYVKPSVDVDTNRDYSAETEILSPERVPKGPNPAAGCPFTGPGDLHDGWRLEWAERAAIREYDGQQAREQAEADAFGEILGRMRQAGELP